MFYTIADTDHLHIENQQRNKINTKKWHTLQKTLLECAHTKSTKKSPTKHQTHTYISRWELQLATGRLTAPELQNTIMRGRGEQMSGGVPGNDVHRLSVRVCYHAVGHLFDKVWIRYVDNGWVRNVQRKKRRLLN